MDDWDPMVAAYENSTFNRYSEGIGRDLSGSGIHNKGLSLYVQNIPVNLGKEGLYNLFAEYGTVLECNVLKPHRDNSDTTVGFILMQSMVDAQNAIAKVNGKRIGRNAVKVSPALTEEEKKNRKQMKERENEILGFIGKNRDQQEHGASARNKSDKQTRQHFQSNRNENQSHVSGPGLAIDKKDWHSLSKAAEESSRMVPKLAISIGPGNRHVTERGATIPLPKEQMLQSLGRGRSNVGNFGCGRGAVVNHFGQPYNGPGLPVAPPGYHNMPWQSRGLGRGMFKPPTQKFSIVAPPPNARVESVKACLFCRKPGCANRCSRCRLYYCSYECQRNDWPDHKDICMTIGRLQHNGQADQNYYQQETYETDIEQPKYHQSKNRDRNVRNYDSDTVKNTSESKGRSKFENDSHSKKSTDRGQGKLHSNSKSQDKRKSGEEKKGSRQENGLNTECLQGSESQKKDDDKSQFLKEDGKTKKQKEQKGNTNQKGKWKNSPKKRINLDGGVIKKQDQKDGADTSDKTTSTDDEALATKNSDDSSNTVIDLHLAVKLSGQAYLTHYESPNKFWLCLHDYLQEFTDTMSVMMKEMKLPPTSVVQPKVGNTYGINYFGDWCRAKVISVEKDEAKVLFVDYGNEDQVKVKDMRPLSVDVIKLPAQVRRNGFVDSNILRGLNVFEMIDIFYLPFFY